MVHVYPINDLKEHDTESHLCECEPRVDFELGIVVHNAYDLREIQEFINKERK